MITVSKSSITLIFPDNKLHDEYLEAQHRLDMEFYGKIRQKCGIFASNQNKFVSNVDELNRFDSKVAEIAYQQYLKDTQ